MTAGSREMPVNWTAADHRRAKREKQERRRAKNEERRARSCHGKVRHVLRSGAEREAKRLGRAYHCYHCRLCRHWHVGRDS